MSKQNAIVLDASAILAILFREPGAETLTDEVLDRARVSAVNLAEVHSKLVRLGQDPEQAWEDAQSLGIPVEQFTPAQAKIAGSLVATTKHLGLSLGDRACLALASTLKADVYTTETVWKKLKVGPSIRLIR
jgi:PIN domain nuclease of toxin-antitoxin system